MDTGTKKAEFVLPKRLVVYRYIMNICFAELAYTLFILIFMT